MIQKDNTVPLAPWYAPNLSFVNYILNNDILFCGKIRHQKKSFRNRTEILNSNGRLRLSIPIEHSRKENQWYKDVKISYAEDWQKNHWNGITASYRKSAFFEYYEHKILSFYNDKKHTFLFDYNIALLQTIIDMLQVQKTFNVDTTNEYHIRTKDFGFKTTTTYLQVFSDRFPFEANLSIFDLLFNLGGKRATDYLLS